MLNAISWCHIQAGYTSVQLAVEQKHEATVEVLLEAIVAAGMDIDARYESRRGGFGGFGAAATSTEQGQTLLMRASALGLTSTVAKLLALGADIAAKDAVLDNVCFSLFQFFFPSSLPFFSEIFFFWFVCTYMYVCMYVK
jgi:ankyrin repeat protein